jgi:protein-S-isoprenylcysteine O-methyltransferase Ste14
MRLGMISPWWVLKIIATLTLLSKMVVASLGYWSISTPIVNITAWPAQLLVILAGIFNLWHFRILKKSAGEIGEPRILVTAGGCLPRIRHPMYTGDLFLMLGLWLLYFDLWGGLLWIAGVTGVVQQARFEDRQLAQRFGEQHRVWRQNSRLLL